MDKFSVDNSRQLMNACGIIEGYSQGKSTLKLNSSDEEKYEYGHLIL